MTPNEFKKFQKNLLFSTWRDNFYTRKFQKRYLIKLYIVISLGICLYFIALLSGNAYIIYSCSFFTLILACFLWKLCCLALEFDIMIIRRYNSQLITPQLLEGLFFKRRKERNRITFIMQREMWRKLCDMNNIPQDCASLHNIKKYILSTIKLNPRYEFFITIITMAFSILITLICPTGKNAVEIVIIWTILVICYFCIIYPSYKLIEAHHNWHRNKYKILLSVIDAEINDAVIFVK